MKEEKMKKEHSNQESKGGTLFNRSHTAAVPAANYPCAQNNVALAWVPSACFNASYRLHRNISPHLCSIYCFIKNMQASQAMTLKW